MAIKLQATTDESTQTKTQLEETIAHMEADLKVRSKTSMYGAYWIDE